MKYAIKMNDGSVRVTVFTQDAISVEDEIAKWSDANDVASYAMVNELPEDKTFRDAWVLSGKEVYVDMEKARIIHMNDIRKLRTKKFIELGFPYKLNQKLEEAIISEEMRKQLQVLRDIPSTYKLDEAKTPEELKKLIPEELK